MNIKETFSLKKIVLMIVGVAIMSFGCGMLVKTGYGADTSNALSTGIANMTGISVGNTNAIATVIFIIISYYFPVFDNRSHRS